MATRRILAAALTGFVAFGMSPVFAQQAQGVLAGRATDEAKQPYKDYAVQLRDAVSGLVINMVPLTPQGQFEFKTVPLSRKHLIELTKDNKVVCTEGPYGLDTANPSKTNVNIECNKSPSNLWLLTAAAGTVAAVAVTKRSTSE
jgi:hypothetical protein